METQTAPAHASDHGAQQAAYAQLGDLRMYYAVYGTGAPLVLLHGAFMNIPAIGPLLPALAQSRQVIAVELEGHGRTNHVDRPLHHTQMADDVAALLQSLGLDGADVFGFSLGGMVGLQLAVRHPRLVRRLVVVSSPYNKQGYYPSVSASWPGLSVETFAGTPVEHGFQQLAPDPASWPSFIDKMKQMMLSFTGWSAGEVAAIRTPTLLIVGDADFVMPEHTLELHRLLGGAPADGGVGEHTPAQLAVLPGANHFNILDRTDLLLPIVLPFLDGEAAPQPLAA